MRCLVSARVSAPLVLGLLALAACAPDADLGESGGSGGGGGSPPAAPDPGDAYDVPIDGVSAEQQDAFFHGDDLFELAAARGRTASARSTRGAPAARATTSGLRGPGSVRR